MKLCDNGHVEICFDGGSCPMCNMQNEIEELKRDNEALEDEASSLSNDLSNANETVLELEAEIEDLKEEQ